MNVFILQLFAVFVAMEPLLPRYILQKRCKDPSSGIRCPPELVNIASANDLQIIDVRIDGNCRLHAAIKSLMGMAKTEHSLSAKAAYKELMRHRHSDTDMIVHLRKVMIVWMDKNRDIEMWDGMSFSQLALIMSTGGHRSFGSYLAYMAIDTHWIDAGCLHAIANIFGVDFLVFQLGIDPTFVGASYHGGKVTIVVPVCMVNDLHYWALVKVERAPISNATIQENAKEKGDWAMVLVPPGVESPSPSRKRSLGGNGEADDHDDMPDIDIEPHLIPVQDVDAQLSLCQELRSWCPWAPPSQELLIAIQSTMDEGADAIESFRWCMARQGAVRQMETEVQLECLCLANLHDSKLYHRAARCHLVKRQTTLQTHDRSRVCAKEMATTIVRIDRARIEKEIGSAQCWVNEKPHSCLHPFQADIGIVKNWRTLWRSLSSAMRRETLLKMYRTSLDEHKSQGKVTEWRVNYTLLGLPVCLNAFCIVTGIGRSMVVAARGAALKKHSSSLSRHELPYHLAILPTNKPKLYSIRFAIPHQPIDWNGSV